MSTLHADRATALRARNKRTGLVLVSIALLFCLGFVAKRLIVG
ncbi:MAG: cytochrome oxidase small assembly protein [Burkholderiales bacterium]